MIDKPKVTLLKDDYALDTGQHWCCLGSAFCARGKTPLEAVTSYHRHIKSLTKRGVTTPTNYR